MLKKILIWLKKPDPKLDFQLIFGSELQSTRFYGHTVLLED